MPSTATLSRPHTVIDWKSGTIVASLLLYRVVFQTRSLDDSGTQAISHCLAPPMSFCELRNRIFRLCSWWSATRRVLTKFERIAAKHFGRVSRIDDAQEKCFPIVLRTSAMIIWGLPSKAQVVEEEHDSSEYSTTPMESVQSLLKEVSKRNANDSDQASQFQWWLGGAFRQSSNKPVFRALCQVDADVYQRIDSRVSLHFVYDLVTNATSFQDLKFVLDAGRCPLRDIPSSVFKETYGLTKELSFKRAEKREANPTDLWSVLY